MRYDRIFIILFKCLLQVSITSFSLVAKFSLIILYTCSRSRFNTLPYFMYFLEDFFCLDVLCEYLNIVKDSLRLLFPCSLQLLLPLFKPVLLNMLIYWGLLHLVASDVPKFQLSSTIMVKTVFSLSL